MLRKLHMGCGESLSAVRVESLDTIRIHNTRVDVAMDQEHACLKLSKQIRKCADFYPYLKRH